MRQHVIEIMESAKSGVISEIDTIKRLRTLFIDKELRTSEALVRPYEKKRISKILLLDSGRCFYCGKRVYKSKHGFQQHNTATIDHALPIQKGGIDHIDNTVLSCFKCNNNKGNNILPDNVQFKPYVMNDNLENKLFAWLDYVYTECRHKSITRNEIHESMNKFGIKSIFFDACKNHFFNKTLMQPSNGGMFKWDTNRPSHKMVEELLKRANVMIPKKRTEKPKLAKIHWQPSDDTELINLYNSGRSYKAISAYFSKKGTTRTPISISRRIGRLKKHGKLTDIQPKLVEAKKEEKVVNTPINNAQNPVDLADYFTNYRADEDRIVHRVYNPMQNMHKEPYVRLDKLDDINPEPIDDLVLIKISKTRLRKIKKFSLQSLKYASLVIGSIFIWEIIKKITS